MRVMSACDAPVVMFLLESLCQSATMERSLHLHPMVTPCLSALWDLDFLFQGCQWAHHSFECFCSSLMRSGTVTFLSLLSGPENSISSMAFLSSNVPGSELQASVFHTLDVGTGGWGDCRCCVQRHAVEVRGLSRIAKTRHHELHFLLPCWTFLPSRAR